MVAQRLDGVEQLIEEPLAAQVARNAQMAPIVSPRFASG